MNIRTRPAITALSLVVMSAIVAIGLFVWLMFAGRVQATDTTDGHLVTIYDRGEEKVLLSNGDTIGAALKEAGVEVDERDVVEPAPTEKMVASEYQVNIYRARPVLIIDGPTRLKVMTAYQTSEQIIKDAGITLYPEDSTATRRSEDFVSSGAGLQLTIDRATNFKFTLYGSTTDARTQAETVGEMLAEKHVILGDNDRVSPTQDTPLTADMAVRVWREGQQTLTVEEAVPFSVEQIQDADRPVGYKAIQTAGQDGLRKVTYEIEIRDGKEISRKEITSLSVREPIKQVEIVGSKPNYLPYTGSGTKSDWLAASNIPQESWGYADFMVARESGWNPNATNRYSGACGLAQALPCSKVPGNPLNPVDSLNWMNAYVNGRYGGWEGAYNFWNTNHWY